MGDTPKGPADQAWAGHPLREITELCGLALGCDDASEDGAVRLQRCGQKRQRVQHLRLAAIGGHLLERDDRSIGGVGDAEGFQNQGRGAL